ncbi:hypothetical protein P154DRAFT_334964 [Amniculicola lignicola CBS 123094]|uniref:Uncharacterized protein n=1 Tax=Amniculicola lignicola CBS 123094 TaxID=1392246 RepID=A0A6A5W1C1_9PLEO|nr:hypothetical protein P154DRAFT_334964 [Amniculicola lignicola CBS 123094]
MGGLWCSQVLLQIRSGKNFAVGLETCDPCVNVQNSLRTEFYCFITISASTSINYAPCYDASRKSNSIQPPTGHFTLAHLLDSTPGKAKRVTFVVQAAYPVMRPPLRIYDSYLAASFSCPPNAVVSRLAEASCSREINAGWKDEARKSGTASWSCCTNRRHLWSEDWARRVSVVGGGVKRRATPSPRRIKHLALFPSPVTLVVRFLIPGTKSVNRGLSAYLAVLLN